MSASTFEYTQQFMVTLDHDADPRAMGGAVTVALCGHWDHEGPCRWPHHTESQEVAENTYRVNVRFDAPQSEHAAVSDRINSALQSGAQAGPDGRVSRWSLVTTHS